MRFPFTFLGFMALAIGLWVVAYLALHRSLDVLSEELAIGTAVLCIGFGVYVIVRRFIRGPSDG